MYSKVYWITSDANMHDALIGHYDDVVTPAIRESAHHVSHQMVEIDRGKWILVSNYKSAEAAEAATPMVRDLVGSMSESFGMKLDVIGEGQTIREVTKAK